MMQDKHLPFNDNTARYCPGSKIDDNGEISPTAFHLRQGESFLSVEWLEYLGKFDRPGEIQAVIDILSKKLRLGSSARIAVLEVGATCSHVRKETGHTIRFLHEPEPEDPAHSGIYDTAVDEMIIAELLAEMVEETHSIK